MLAIPALAPPALPAGHGAPAVAAASPVAIVTAVAAGSRASGGTEANLAERHAPPPHVQRDKPREGGAQAPRDDAGRAPVLALMRQAEAVVRIANAGGRGVPEAGYGLALAQAQAGLQVQGELITRGEAGLKIGTGQIFRAGALIASFAGSTLAFVGEVDRRV